VKISEPSAPEKEETAKMEENKLLFTTEVVHSIESFLDLCAKVEILRNKMALVVFLFLEINSTMKALP